MHYNGRKQQENGYILYFKAGSTNILFSLLLCLFQNLQKPQPERYTVNTMLSHSEHNVTHLSDIGTQLRAQSRAQVQISKSTHYIG